ncbi:hypothetical protein E2320_014592 [Naja naja]|nr:hypothetical protein E2320_014592 [Naja naja]
MQTSAGYSPMQEKKKMFYTLIKSQIKIIVCQLDDKASGMLAAIIQIIDMTNTSLVGRVWIATTLKALSVSIFDLWIDLQNKHALFSFFIQKKRRIQYYDFKSYASMVILYGKEAFQCSYSSPLLSKKVWKKCREKVNWEFPSHDVITRILSQDSSSISQIIQIVAWVLNAASSSQKSKRRMQVGYHQPSQIVQPWQSQIKIIVCQLDDKASGILAAIIQIIDMTNKSLVGRVWIATTLKALSVSIFDLWIDLQNKHALFSFFMQTKRRTKYYDFKSYASMVTLYGKEAFQCSYSSPLFSKKVWKKCREKENWEFPSHDVIARILSQDSSSISQIIQIVAWVLNAASSSQKSKRRMQVGYHQPSQIVQPWQASVLL